MRSLFEAVRFQLARLASGRRAAALVLVPLVALALVALALDGVLERGDRLPVAVVNLDEGAVDADGHRVAAGDDLVDSLTETEQLVWDPVDATTAQAGLDDGTYALVLEIPEDYSACVASVSSGDPEKAELRIVSSGAANVLSTTYGTDVLKQVQARCKSDLGESYLLSVLSDARGQASRISLTADGSVMLDEGYAALEQGSAGIGEGLSAVASAAAPLASGTEQIGGGVRAVGEGVQGLSAALSTMGQGVEPLVGGLNLAGDGLDALAGAADDLAGTADDLAGELGALSPGLLSASGALSSSRLDGTVDESATLLSALEDRRAELADERGSVDAAIDGLAGLDAAAAGSQRAADEAGVLADAVGVPADPASGSAATGLVADVGGASARLDELIASAGEDGSVSVEDLARFRDEELARVEAGTEEVSGKARTTADAASSAAQGVRDAATGADGASAALDGYAAAADGFEGASQALLDQLNGSLAPQLDALATAQRDVDAAARALGPTAPGDPTSGSSALDKALALAYGLPAVADGIDRSAAGVGSAAEGVGLLGAGIEPVAAGLDGLAQGNVALADALGMMGEGLGGLGTGLGGLAQGSGMITQGIGALRESSSQIADNLSASADALSGIAPDPEGQAAVASSPVALNVSRQGEPSGFLPLAVAAALWAGAAVTSLIVEPVSRRMALAGSSPLAVAVAGAVPYAVVGLAQALAIGIASLLVGIAPASPAWFALSLAAGSVCFACVAQALRSLLGRAGAVAAMAAWLVLALVSGGGALPAAFAAPLFRALSPAMPAAQLAQVVRAAVSGVVGAPAWVGLACLAGIAVAALAASAVAAARLRHVRPESLSRSRSTSADFD